MKLDTRNGKNMLKLVTHSNYFDGENKNNKAFRGSASFDIQHIRILKLFSRKAISKN